MSKNCALIVAGGKGKRVGKHISKQFIEIKDKPIICYTLEAFEKSNLIDEIIVVISKDDMDYFRKNILERYKFNKIIGVVQGGAERQDSAYNGLMAIEKCDIVLIHDGARPFVSEKIIEEGIKYASIYGAAACGVIPKDTIKVRNDHSFSQKSLERSSLFAVQTPQCFKYEAIIRAHEQCRKKQLKVTDDTMVMESCGAEVYLYEGSYSNIKVTTPEDLALAEYLAYQ